MAGAQTKTSGKKRSISSSFSMRPLLLTSPATEDDPGSTVCGHRTWRHAAATNHVSLGDWTPMRKQRTTHVDTYLAGYNAALEYGVIPTFVFWLSYAKIKIECLQFQI